MRDQDRRDKVTVDIATGLVVFVLVIAIGAVLLIAARQAVAMSAGLLNILGYVVLGCGSAVSIAYLYRHHRR